MTSPYPKSHLSALALVVLVGLSLTTIVPAQTADAAKTFKAQNGAAPWFDRVGNWQLADLPPTLVNAASDLPQQSCGSRAITKPDQAAALLIGVSQKDLPAFSMQFSSAQTTADVFSVKNPQGATIPYTAVYLPGAPAQVAPQGMQAGLVILRLDPPVPTNAVPMPTAPPAKPAAFAPAATPTANPPTAFAVPARDKFDVYVLMGQSNMLGRDVSKLAEQVDDPKIGSLESKGWLVARDPMFGGSGTGPGLSFAAEMAKTLPSDAKIGLVQCAVGGTPLSRWVKGADLYERALVRVKLAAQQGTLKGMLWHQGESDSNTVEDASTYAARLSQMIADFRADVGVPNLPVVVGKLGPFRLEDKGARFTTQVNDAIAKVARTAPRVGLAEATGLKDKGDHTHFTAEAQIEFGKRYAQAMSKL